MRRMWPDEFAFLLNDAEEVGISIIPLTPDDASPRKAVTRRALKARISQEDFEKIWPLAETRYRLSGNLLGKAITLITSNPHYRDWHPSDGGSVEDISDSGQHYTKRYVIVHFLLDDVRETAEA